MKFKILIIAFSIVILLAIAVVVMLPMMFSGADIASTFQKMTLPMLIFMAILLIGMGIFFFYNYRLLSLLEREDWPALAYYLEQKCFTKGNYSNRNVRLLASSYLVLTDYASVLKLESKAMPVNPSVVNKNLLLFGTARILSGNYAEASAFLKTYLDKGSLNRKDRQWTRLFIAFSLLLSGAFKLSQPEFASLAASSQDGVITGLSAFFLNKTIAKHSDNPAECIASSDNGRSRVLKTIKNFAQWKKETAKLGSDIHVAIIKKYISETGEWLYTSASERS